MYTLITKEDSRLVYEQLATAHMLAVLMSGNDQDNYSKCMITAIVKVIGNLVKEKHEEVNYSLELMKTELTQGMNACLEDKTLVDEFGELWLAKENKLMDTVEKIADTYVSKMIADYQAINN